MPVILASVECGRFFSTSRNRQYLVKNLQNHHVNAISLEKFTVDVELSNNYQEFKSDINRCLSYVAGAPCKNLNLLKLCQLFITDEWLSNLISELPFREYIHIHL